MRVPHENIKQNLLFLQGLDDPKLIFQCLPVSLAGRTFNVASSAERVPGDASLKRLKLGPSFGGGEDSPARSLIIAARANSKRLSSMPQTLQCNTPHGC